MANGVQRQICFAHRYCQASEIKFRRELHQARIACEGCDSTYRRAIEVSFGKRKLRCIEHIEHLPANLQAATLAEVVEGAGQRHVEVSQTRAPQGVAPTISELGLLRTRGRAQRRRRSVRGRVKPPVYGAIAP